MSLKNLLYTVSSEELLPPLLPLDPSFNERKKVAGVLRCRIVKQEHEFSRGGMCKKPLGGQDLG